MEIGKLNQRISILKNNIHTDEIGNHLNTWESVYDCWAYITANSSSENFESGVTYDSLTYSFYIRQNQFTSNLTTTNYRIEFKEQLFDIKGIIFDFNLKDYIKIEAQFHKKGDDKIVTEHQCKC